MDIERINVESAEVKLCLHSEQPDVPKRTAAEAKDFFDSMAKSIVIPKINEIVDELPQKADGETTYNKTEVDTLLDGKADSGTTYSKTEVDEKLLSKADSDTVYKKEEVDKLLKSKINSDSVYTIAELDLILNEKADAEEMTKSLGKKADVDTVYDKTEIDDMLTDKVDHGIVYTKDEVDKKMSAVSGGTPAEIADITVGMDARYIITPKDDMGSYQNIIFNGVITGSFYGEGSFENENVTITLSDFCEDSGDSSAVNCYIDIVSDTNDHFSYTTTGQSYYYFNKAFDVINHLKSNVFNDINGYDYEITEASLSFAESVTGHKTITNGYITTETIKYFI